MFTGLLRLLQSQYIEDTYFHDIYHGNSLKKMRGKQKKNV